jgi:hypothetical protein
MSMMSSTLSIHKGPDFVSNFLGTIGKVAEDSIIDVTNDNINSLCSTSDGTLIQYITYNNKNTFNQTLNVPDIKRFHKIVGCVQSDQIELQVDDNCINYKSPGTRFKYHLLDDGILSTPAISVSKIEKLTYDNQFTIAHSKLTELIKGSTFANESEKLYLYTSSDGNLYGELTDKEKPNMDSFCIKMSEESKPTAPVKPIAFNFENIRIISSTRCTQLNFKLNTQMSVARVDISSENCKISYIISALIK